ncbi:MAG: DUF1015 domain-containing protein [Acutalibacteraceae bacterium]|nr:DUF1015 domain-containing protein [Acutalibacteraceae bacterium]
MKNTYFLPANILLPKSNFEKWAVVACDQYTSEPEYWKEVEKTVGNEPSALNLILPEVYLSADNSNRIEKINRTMTDYLENGVFREIENTFIYLEREVTGEKIRKGVVGLIDLENYSYEKGSKALIRATEATVLERIPPRVLIRKDAKLEMPHVMLLIDDPKCTVIEPLEEKINGFEKLYDFGLMQQSGHIKGYSVDDETAEQIQNALSALVENTEDKLLFAVGDGNHSLATAKECYNLNKTENSRYALVEIVNIHDTSLEFEPIYRVVFGVEPEKFIENFVTALGGEYFGMDAQKFTCVYGDSKREVSLKPTGKLAVATLQTYLDEYLKQNKNVSIDYIHGEDVVYSLCKAENTVGFIFEGMQKSELFDAIKQDGSLPRKTFSMGHAADKRFYIEARKL